MAVDPQTILNTIKNTADGGRDYQISPPLNTNTGELSQTVYSPKDEIFSLIPEDIQSKESQSVFTWEGASWFPEDLGSERNAYYVKFEVFMLDTKGGTPSSSTRGELGKEVTFTDGGPRMAQNLRSGGQLRNKGILGSPVLKKLSEIIALPMPDSLVTDHSTLWSKAEGGLVSAMVAMGDEFLNSGSVSEAATRAAKAMSLGVASGIGGILEQMDLEGAKTNLKLLTKRAANPRNEFLFDGVNNRSFNLQWKLIPRTEAEAIKLRDLLEKMKLYMYPELDQSTGGNFFLFPAVFDITFMRGAEENDWLYRTSTCALTNMIINYTGMGQWVATTYFGAPVAWEVTMQFTEMEFLHRDRFMNASNPNGVAR